MSDVLTQVFVNALRRWPARDPELDARGRLLLLDGVAVAVAGATEPGPSFMADLVRSNGAAGSATLIGRKHRASPIDAARINGMAMHVLDYEPMWHPPNHAISTLLPALLALAEQRERQLGVAQGEALLRALFRGIEAQGRLRLASRQLEAAQLRLHPPGVVGPLAAALACADLLGLDNTATAAAVGIAASRSGGVLSNIGSHTKALHCGDAAAHGLEAALLASRGFTAGVDALGGPRGWGQAYFGVDFDETVLRDSVSVPRALMPGPSWKLFPSQFATHFGITAALDARPRIRVGDDSGIDVASIRSIALRVPSMPYIDRAMPATGLEGKFSWQYTVVIALLDGRVDIDSFTDTRRHAPEVQALLERFVVIPDETIPGAFDAMHVELTVHLASGDAILVRCDAPLGSWRRPVDDTMIADKAVRLLERGLGARRAQAALDAATRDVASLAIVPLLNALRSPTGQAPARHEGRAHV